MIQEGEHFESLLSTLQLNTTDFKTSKFTPPRIKTLELLV